MYALVLVTVHITRAIKSVACIQKKNQSWQNNNNSNHIQMPIKNVIKLIENNNKHMKILQTSGTRTFEETKTMSTLIIP